MLFLPKPVLPLPTTLLLLPPGVFGGFDKIGGRSQNSCTVSFTILPKPEPRKLKPASNR